MSTTKKKTTIKKKSAKPQIYLIRTYSAGVHVGEIVKRSGQEVTLKNASRIWRWRGANTLNEVSVSGVNRNEYTRISERVPEIVLLNAIEIIKIANVDLSPIWYD